MFNKLKKKKFNILAYLFCAFAMALFIVLSFSCKTYAYSIDNNGNLVGENLLNIVNGSSTINNITITKNNGVITLNGINNNSNYTYYRIAEYNFNGNETYYISGNNTGVQIYVDTTGYPNETSFTDVNGLKGIYLEIAPQIQYNNFIYYPMLNIGSTKKNWEPYGVWYSETNFDTIDNLYNNALAQYNDLALGNNYGYWKYIDYVEFYESNNNIFVPGTQDQNEWSITNLTTNNILKIGGYFDTTPLTLEPYQSNYNEVDSYISFRAYTPSESFIMTFGSCIGCNVVINDENSNSFSYTISEGNYLIDINLIRQNVPSFGLYVIEMYIQPNNAEQNGIYFANNDYITAYNKGYNVATSNADRKYIPQITDLQNQINSLNNNVIELTNNINTLKSLNDDLQEQINSTYSWQNLFFAFADTPFKVVSNVLGFELFGLNLFSTFIGMITVFGVVYLLKKFF